ncbi:hypothetical protein [Rhizobium leguminosarum]|nr:hypothetical protein [Rhizobium leguminosarum]
MKLRAELTVLALRLLHEFADMVGEDRPLFLDALSNIPRFDRH